MNGKQLLGRTITVELSGRPPKGGEGDRGPGPPPRGDDRSDMRGSFAPSGGGNSRTANSSESATRNLFVGNIPPDATEADVLAHFSQYGHVSAVKFLPKKSDTIAAFVDFHNADEARTAHDQVNMMGDMKLRTDYNNRGAPPRGPPPRSDDLSLIHI